MPEMFYPASSFTVGSIHESPLHLDSGVKPAGMTDADVALDRIEVAGNIDEYREEGE